MPYVEKPPIIENILQDDAFPSFVGNPEAQKLVHQANEKCLHWAKLKYYPWPSWIKPEMLWALIKLGRGGIKRALPITDKNGDSFSFWFPDSLLKALNDVDRGAGRLIGAEGLGQMPGNESYVISSLMEEAIASSQLEGASTTRRVAKEMLRSGRGPQNKSEQMILNNWHAIQHLRTADIKKLTPEHILHLQAILTEKTVEPDECGHWRKDDNIVVEYEGEVVHEPPPVKEIAERMKALCTFANNDEEPWVHPVVKAIALHFWLAYNHPFSDGNGRTARALQYWYLLSRGYWLFEYLAISRFIVNAPGKYMRAYLYTETDEGDLTYFINYNLRSIQYALEEVRIYIARKQKELSVSGQLLRTHRHFNARQKGLIYDAIQHPDTEYSIHQHLVRHGIAYDTARHDLLDLNKKGFFKKAKRGKSFVFLPVGRMIEKLRQKI